MYDYLPAAERSTPPASISIVGAGPGDPDLLTVKALRRLQDAEIVVYDRLIAPAILALAAPRAELIFVGKEAGRHVLPQDEINALLVRLAPSGKRIVRLKGGDPFIFGRGSEEALALAAHGIAYEIVPGISAAAACSAYAGIPLTHRGYANGVRFVTGHCKDDAELDLDWEKLADPAATLAIYMGLANAQTFVDRLTAAGLAGDTPAAAIENGTQPGERIRLTTLAGLPAALTTLKPPTLIIVGKVVSLAPALAWRESARAAAAEALVHA